jgi:hypothetical protein
LTAAASSTAGAASSTAGAASRLAGPVPKTTARSTGHWLHAATVTGHTGAVTGLCRLWQVDEQPLVVAIPLVVDRHRGLGRAADDAYNAATAVPCVHAGGSEWELRRAGTVVQSYRGGAAKLLWLGETGRAGIRRRLNRRGA